MKVIVLGGAAFMAQPAIHYLLEKEYVQQIVLADLNVERVQRLSEQLGPKVSAVQMNITDRLQMQEVVKGANLVMNFVGPYFRFGTNALEAAIEAGVNYIDICDDYDVTMEALKWDERAKEKGVLAITGIGASPGITNILARLGADALDQATEVNTYWVVGDAEPSGFGALIHMFHIIEGEIPTFQEGKEQLVKAFQQDTAEEIDFGGPVGKVRLYHVGHPEPVTLPKYIPTLQKATNLGALLPAFQNPMFKTLVDLGMTSEEPIQFRNEPVAPIEFLLTLFHEKQEKGRQKAQQASTKPQSVSGARVEVIGVQNGQPVSYTFTKSGFDSMANGTSLPAGVTAALLLEGQLQGAGVLPPEGLDPQKILNALLATGYFDGERGFLVEKKGNGPLEKGSIVEQEKFPELWSSSYSASCTEEM